MTGNAQPVRRHVLTIKGPAFIRGKPARLAGMARLTVLDRLMPCFLLKRSSCLYMKRRAGLLAEFSARRLSSASQASSAHSYKHNDNFKRKQSISQVNVADRAG